jgi:type IV pilus assembly protein PilM
MLGTERILGLDIGASTVKVAEFQHSKTHGLRLTNFNYADLGIDPEHEENRNALIVSTVRNVLREKNIGASKVVFSVSGQSVFTRFVKLPPVDETKVTQIIQYEAQQNVPFPIDEVIWDYQLIGSSAQGELEVVLLAIKSDIIEELKDAVESAGLSTDLVDVAPMALYNSVRYNYGDPEGCTVVLDIGARTTNLLFLEKNKVFSRSIPIAGNAITQSIAAEFNIPFLDAEQMKKSKGFVALGGAYEEPPDETQARVSKIIRNVMTRLHAEVARSINFYKGQQGGSAPARLLLSGGSSIIPYTDRFFQEKVQIPIEYFNPFRNVEIDPRVSRDELARCAHFFGEVVGLGLRKATECPIEVNLAPKTIRTRQQMQEKRPYFAGAAVCLLLIPLCGWLYTNKTAKIKDQELQSVREHVQQLDTLNNHVHREQSRLSELQGKADQIVGLVQQRSLWPALLEDLNERLVTNLWIVSFSPQLNEPAGQAPPTAPVGNRRRGRGRGGDEEPPEVEAAPTAGTPAGPRAITEFLIGGMGNHVAENPEQDLRMVDDFAQNLRDSRYFDKQGVEIVIPPNPMMRESRFTFSLRVKLAKPIQL